MKTETLKDIQGFKWNSISKQNRLYFVYNSNIRVRSPFILGVISINLLTFGLPCIIFTYRMYAGMLHASNIILNVPTED